MSPSTANASAVVPSVATPVVTADKDARLAAPAPATSPVLKDLRAFEHDRQRVKKAADRAKTRKGRGWSALAKGEAYLSSRKGASQPSSEKTKLLRADEVDPLEDDLAYDAARAKVPRPAGHGAQPVAVEVKLADLVTLSGYRKTRKAPMGDFVVIPARSVIPLDDFDSVARELVIEEPWEHIYALDDDDQSPATTPTKVSYADVLTMNSK
ncbi:hypothetical protein MKEN_00904800 [Mycena kentingensis (nom. inval.)]|nr:hypothetical protein MKEN_00904800 [Mycena kentingensis (nom. inval.)]